MSTEKSKVESLREKFGNIERVDPEGEAYKNLCEFLDKQDTATLRDLTAANIKFVSSLAGNRYFARAAKGI